MVQEITYSGHVPSLVDTVLYEPTIRAGLRAATVARRLQTGNIRTYAAYLLGLVIGLLAARADGSAVDEHRRRGSGSSSGSGSRRCCPG